MKKVIALVATENIDVLGYKFTKGALEQITSGARGLPLIIHFDRSRVLGSIENASLSEKGVEVFIDLTQDLPLEDLYIVPGGVIEESHKEGEVTVFDKFKLTSLSITDSPSDKSLTPIQKEDKEK